MTTTGRTRWVIFRDLIIFQIKLVLDGMKDIVLAPISITAAAVDLVFPGPRPGHRFYGVMRIGEKFDRWLSLFAAADKADAREDGLFGASRAGAPSLLGRLEAIMLGHEESDEPAGPPRRENGSARTAGRAGRSGPDPRAHARPHVGV